jgi:hypothetical protein
MAPLATGLVGVHGFDLARDAVIELQVLVCECACSEVAQIADSLKKKGSNRTRKKDPSNRKRADKRTRKSHLKEPARLKTPKKEAPRDLRCVSEGAEHSGVDFPGFAVLTKALLNRTGLPALSTVELLALPVFGLSVFRL